MAVAVDSTGTEQGFTTAATTQTYTGLTVSSGLSNSAATFCVIATQAAGGLAGATFSATFGGSACTQIGRYDMGNGVGSLAIFGIKNPASGSGKSLVVTTTNSCIMTIQGTSWSGVDQTTPFQNFNHKDQNPTPVSSDTLVITTANGNETVATTAMGGTATYSFSPGNIYTADTTTLAGVGATAMGAQSASTTSSTTYTASQGSSDFIVIVGCDIKAAGGANVVIPNFIQDVPLLNAGQANLRRQLDAFAFTNRFFGVKLQSSLWPFAHQGFEALTNPNPQSKRAVGTNQVSLFHSPFNGTLLKSSIWPFQYQCDNPQPPKKDWSFQAGTSQQVTTTTQVQGGAFASTQDVPQKPKQQLDQFSSAATIPQRYGGAFTNIQEAPFRLRIQRDGFAWHSSYNLTPTAFGYQPQQDVPQLPKKQLDQSAFHSPFGLYFPSFSWQLQQDTPQLPKKQLDQFAFRINFSGALTPTQFGYQPQQDVPQLPKKQWDQSAFHSPSSFGTRAPTNLSFQLQQDIPQLPKRDWSVTTVAPLTFFTTLSGKITAKIQGQGQFNTVQISTIPPTVRIYAITFLPDGTAQYWYVDEATGLAATDIFGRPLNPF